MEIFIKKIKYGKLSINAGETTGLQIISRTVRLPFVRKRCTADLEESGKTRGNFKVYRSKGLSMPLKR
jgi:hypothetical protein